MGLISDRIRSFFLSGASIAGMSVEHVSPALFLFNWIVGAWLSDRNSNVTMVITPFYNIISAPD